MDNVDRKNEFLNLQVLQNGVLSMPTLELSVCLNRLLDKMA